ncbi:MAG: hypothetical protein U9R60_15915 [Bacteroidota bacterium]|nr:hypothetical protein [Bacteroidota bacterium]
MRKRILWIGGSIIAFLILVMIILSIFISNFVESEARAYLKKHPPKGYILDFEKISVRPWSRTIKVKNITFISNLDSLPGVKPGNEPLNVHIESIKIAGVNLFRGLKSKNYKVSKIEVINPRGRILTSGSVFNAKHTVERSHKAGIDSTRKNPFNTLEAGDILVLDAELAIIDSITQQKLLTASNVFFDFKGVYMDSSLSMFRAADIHVDIRDNEVVLPGDLYKVKYNRLRVTKLDSTISIDSLQLIPLYEKYKFAREVGKQTDRFTFGMDSLNIYGVNFDSLLMIQEPILRLIEVNGLHASIFRDKHRPFDFSNYPKLPHEALRTMDKDITVEEVRINNGYVEYIEHEAGAENPGKVFFEEINGSILNITSDSLRILEHPAMEINATMMLFGKGKLEAYIQMPLNDPKDNFTFKGHLTEMQMKEVNHFLSPSAMVDVNSGQIDDLSFTASANRYVGKGSMNFLYNSLTIDVLKEKDGKIKRRWFISTIATSFVKNENPSPNKPVRVAPMYFDRDMNKGIINFLWKTIFSGIKETLLPSKQKDNNQGKSKKEK